MSGPALTLGGLNDAAPAHRVALAFADGSASFGDLAARSSRLARLLAARGVARGDRVGLWMPNRPEWMVAALACWRLGAGVFALNPRLRAGDMGKLIAQSGIRALIFEGETGEAPWAEILREIPEERRASLALLVSAGAAPEILPDLPQVAMTESDALSAAPLDAARPDDVAMVFATSGTTSGPKLVLHSHERLAAQARDIAARLLPDPAGARPLLSIPFAGAFGFTIALMSLASAATLLVERRFVPAESVARIRAEGVTHLYGTDDMADKWLEAAEGTPAFPSVSYMGFAAYTPNLGDIAERAEARGLRMIGMYGMSELLAFFSAQPADAPAAERGNGGGHALCPTARMRVCHPDDDRELPSGEAGELQVLSPNRFLEYLDNPEANAGAFAEGGWFRTGDLARMTPDGRMVFLSRIKDVLRLGGWLTDPAEIEAVVRAQPGVASAQVVAIPMDRSVRPVACVIARAGETPDEAAIIAACQAELAIWKAPVRVLTFDDFPVTDSPNGAKVQRNVLRDRAAARLGA